MRKVVGPKTQPNHTQLGSGKTDHTTPILMKLPLPDNFPGTCRFGTWSVPRVRDGRQDSRPLFPEVIPASIRKGPEDPAVDVPCTAWLACAKVHRSAILLLVTCDRNAVVTANDTLPAHITTAGQAFIKSEVAREGVAWHDRRHLFERRCVRW